MTLLLFRDDAYLQEAIGTVLTINDGGGIVLDQSIFYAAGGGQPGDTGWIEGEHGALKISTAIYDDVKKIIHMAEPGGKYPEVGSQVKMRLDWPTRYRNMRAHTMMHLLCASVPFPVTGGAISEDGGRIDFDIPEGQIPHRDALTERINALILEDHAVTFRWITDEEMLESQHLIRTMSVKPPMGTGLVRLVMIGADGKVDMQPCGGTHVRSTAEIGPIRVAKIENKGKINRRIRVAFA